MPTVFPNPPQDVSALLATQTPAIVQQVITDSLVSMGIRADLWPKEGVGKSIITAVANLFSGAFNATLLPALKSGWLPTSTGAWLEWLAFYMYGVSKIAATFATGSLLLTNGGGASFSFAPFTATFKNSATKKTYTNLTAIALGPLGTQTISIQATEAGSSSSAVPLAVDTIVTTMLAVTCSNLAPVLGIDDQTDPSLQLACWNSIAANSPFGPRQAYAYAIQTALNSVSQTPVNINRWLISSQSTDPQLQAMAHTGQITVYVASPSGAADANDVTGVATNIEAIARPECVRVTVLSAVAIADTDTITVYVRRTPGLVAATVQAAMDAALVVLFRGDNGSNPIGGNRAGSVSRMFAAAVEGALYDAWPPKPSDPAAAWASAVFQIVGANDYISTGGVPPSQVSGSLLPNQVVVKAITVVVVLV